MLENDKKIAEKIKQEVTWWAYFAWTIPIVALAALFFLETFGLENLYHKVMLIGAVIFFSIAVFWWWWAIFKIKSIAELMSNAADRFSSLKEDLKNFRKDTIE